MRSFAVIAGFAAAANAYAYGYPAYNASSAAVEYPAASTPAGYAAPSSAAGYVASSKVEYPSYTTTTVKGLTTVCAEPTTLKVGSKTYTVTKSTTIIDNDCEYTTTVPVKSTPTSVKGSSAPVVKTSSVSAKVSSVPAKVSSVPVVKSSGVPPVSSGVPPVSSAPVVPYPSKNGTTPTYAVPTGSSPTSTKPSVSQFTGAAAQTGAAMLAIVGAVAAFL